MISSLPAWICCQIGAREHYAIPRSLHRTQQLATLMTDAWISPRSPLNALPIVSLKGLKDRYHPELESAPVQAFTQAGIQFEIGQRLRKTSDWERMINRNRWFQRCVIRQLEQSDYSNNVVLFAYSYAALELLKYAKNRGWRTVLGQIDPGIYEEKIVAEEYERCPTLAPDWQPVPPSYWDTWKQECELADCILVNSDWSAGLLERAGVDSVKLRTVPLVYESPSPSFTRTYPTRFSQGRSLRVLFLGQVTIRKGVVAILEAVRQLEAQPIEFWFVGAQQIAIPAEFVDHPQVRWMGAVPRSQTQHYYQQADVFLFPTLSDGFGLTQLEAQAWQLPLITSQFCGEVVRDGVSGVVLPEVTGGAIAAVLKDFLADPERLARLAQASGQTDHFSLSHLSKQLQTIQVELNL
jgi:glycosyltransferase involved in cell wall biosynthesis